MEELAFMDPETFKDIALPLLSMKNSAMIGFSTKAHNPTNFMKKLIDSGGFEVIERKYICPSCEKKGQRQQACIHERDSMPHFGDEDRLPEVRKFLGEEDDERFAIEMIGMDPSDHTRELFPANIIREIFSNPRVQIHQPIRYIFVNVDPCAGSEKEDMDRPSDFAVTSTASPWPILLGLEAFKSNRTEEYMPKLLNHIRRLLSLPYCKEAIIVLDVEVGTGHAAGDVPYGIRTQLQDVRFCEMKDYEKKPGRKMLHETKVEIANLTRSYFMSKRLGIYEKLVTSHERPNELLAEFRDQLLRYQRNTKELGQGRVKVEYGGKQGGKRDDMAVCFQRSVKSMGDFQSDGQYFRFWR